MHAKRFMTLAGLCAAGLLLIPAPADADKPYVETQPKTRWNPFHRLHASSPAGQLSYADGVRADARPRAAGRAYRSLIAHWPEVPEAPTAQRGIADTWVARGKLWKAFDAYQVLFDEYPGLFPHELVLSNQFEIATRLMYTRKAKFLFLPGFSAPEQAIPLFEKIVANGPRWTHAAQAQYLIGYANELAERWELAVAAYLATENRYPGTPQAVKSGFGRVHCLYLLALESPNDPEALENAWVAATVFQDKYPDSEQLQAVGEYREALYQRRAKAAYDRALFYEKVARKPAAALTAYRQFLRQYPRSDWTRIVENRIRHLEPTVEVPRE